MKVAVASWNSPEFAPLAAVVNPGKREYCERHGYHFEHIEEPYRDGYQRYDVAVRLLQEYDAVLSLDADCMVMNHTIKAERLYVEGKVLHISDDIWGVNDGVFFAIRTSMALQLLNAYVSLGRYPSQTNMDTQTVLKHFIDCDLYRPYVYKERQRDINSYRNHLYGRPEWFTGTYASGDWICQWPGLSNDVRIPLMQEALAEVIR